MADAIGVLSVAAAIGAAIAYQFAYAGSPDNPPNWRASLIKTMAVGGLALACLAERHIPTFGAIGLALGALGDFFLSRRGKAAFLSGMAAFALGHLAYASAFSGFFLFDAEGGLALGADLPRQFWAAAGVLALLLIAAEIWLAPHTGDLRWPVRAYGLMIAAMGLAVALVPWMRGMLFAGTWLFMFSDLVLAARLFVLRDPAHKRRAGLVLWPAYFLAQLLIFVALNASWGHLYITAKG